MKFLLDMGISPSLVPVLEEWGHQARHLVQEGQVTLEDPAVLAKARAERAVLLTHDLGFGDLLSAGGESLPSVVLFRLRNMRPERVAAAMRRVLDGCSEALERGAVVSVGEKLVRVRTLPLTRGDNAGVTS